MDSEKRIQKYQFNLKNLLGQGSYASVYRGKVIDTNEPVAIKVIDKRIFTSSFNLKNLYSQIDIMKKVNHNNMVKLHDIFQTSNNMYIVTQLCDFDLYTYLKQKKRLTQQQAIDFLKQIMKGIKYLNSNNIIHRDLKPANILIKNKICKISDFGFAKNMENQNSLLKSIVGTPLYMSPQLLQKQKYTNKSDIWSVGLIFYQMLHGKTPWMAANQLQLITAIYSQKVHSSKLISESSRDFINKCLVIREQDRMSWQQAFQHPLIKQKSQKQISNSKIFTKSSIQNKSSIILKNKQNLQYNIQNNSYLMNFNSTLFRKDENKIQKCLTPKMNKNISQIKLKKVQALTPKSNFVNINNKLKQVIAFNQNHMQNIMNQNKPVNSQKKQLPFKRKRNMTLQNQLKLAQLDN